jgi:oligopeptide transport system substrate-binding protein
MGKELNPTFVSNGPFRLAKIESGGLSFVRSETYWDKDSVRLEKVQIVSTETPEKALEAYRAGELDAITNIDFSPLVLKLLSPYEDFRRTTHSALNFYEVNVAKAPFSDRRVREALSNAIDRDRLTEGEMDDSTRPALNFLPYGGSAKAKLTQDKEKARELLSEAGFPEGEGFPVIKLLVNRNDTQQKVARSVARMWKQNLNVDTEIIVKEGAELDRARKAGEFDLVRRGVVFPTSDETVNFMAVFETPVDFSATGTPVPGESKRPSGPSAEGANTRTEGRTPGADNRDAIEPLLAPILTEDDAIYELRAIPLYFPTSYSLVKPYVTGFEMNSLDILDLASVTIDSDWRPAK